MSRRLKQVAVVLVVIFAVSQLICPDRTNPLTDTWDQRAGPVGAPPQAPRASIRFVEG